MSSPSREAPRAWVPTFGFGDRLRAIRRDLRLSQEEMAARLAVKHSGGMSATDCPDCGHPHRGAYIGGVCVHVDCPCPWQSPAVLADLRIEQAENAVVRAAERWEIFTEVPVIGPLSKASARKAVQELRAAVQERRAALDARGRSVAQGVMGPRALPLDDR